MDKKLFFYELECRGYIFKNKRWDETKHSFEDDVLNMVWEMWSSAKHGAKAQAVVEKTVQLHLVWNENKDECVGFLDSKDARYTATGDDRGMFGVTALGDYFRDLNDQRDEFETEEVMIEAQEPAND